MRWTAAIGLFTFAVQCHCGLALSASDLPDGPDSADTDGSSIDTSGPTDTDETPTDSDLSGWVFLDSGQFEMGSTSGDSDETPIRTVTVSAFLLMRTEITVEQYEHCVEAGQCTPLSDAACLAKPPVLVPQSARNCLTFQEALDYCAFVDGFLPSEAQWEFAASSRGANQPYPWGVAPPMCEHAVMKGCASGPAPPCTKPTGNTTEGLCDMGGNMREWVMDWYQNTYEPCPTDGTVCEGPSQLARAMRGGAYNTPASYLRNADRGANYPTEGQVDLGARCARFGSQGVK
ncbi:MAG: formylglycine-generating enzyme family protein [Myxococcota bacterium]|jgi:formylglycine-generating enzyme required for sulfatase activity|nr:formylglycine-generating enzyme family protein [Myxococcota bacterium]